MTSLHQQNFSSGLFVMKQHRSDRHQVMLLFDGAQHHQNAFLSTILSSIP